MSTPGPGNSRNRRRRRNRGIRDPLHIGAALPSGVRRQLNGATSRVFETSPRRIGEGDAPTADYAPLRDVEGRLVMDQLNEGLRGSRVLLMEVRTELTGRQDESMEIRAGPGSLFAPFQHYHLQSSTGNRQDTVWVVNRPWDELYTSWTNAEDHHEGGTALRGRIRADGRLVIRVWFRPGPNAALDGRLWGYSLPARTPMDFDNPDF
nr:MAG: hypothetical protein [Guiyang Paspalum paspaloides tombus-like virus 1]